MQLKKGKGFFAWLRGKEPDCNNLRYYTRSINSLTTTHDHVVVFSKDDLTSAMTPSIDVHPTHSKDVPEAKASKQTGLAPLAAPPMYNVAALYPSGPEASDY